MMRTSIIAFATIITAGAAQAAATLSIPLELGNSGSVTSLTYACDGDEPLSVQYVNAGANSLALLPVDGEIRVFVNVVAASGARYVSGTLEWWTKGDTAMLENLVKEASEVTCTAQ